MPGQPRLPLNRVIRLVAQADRREFTLFLGAGASRSSGVPLASEMIAEWRRMVFEDRAGPEERRRLERLAPDEAGRAVDAWCHAQRFEWCGAPHEYSALFETLFPNPRARQRYVEPKVEGAFPSWGYLYLANIVHRGYFNVIFTTNFDDLINHALTTYLKYNAVVCAADSEVASVRLTTDRTKIIKLHGDYLFQQLKNTVDELEQLDPNMDSKLRDFGKQCGMVVIGYAGHDRSVMRVFRELLGDERAFPNGVYWGVRPGTESSDKVAELARAFDKRFHLFDCPDFDGFMVQLHTALRLDLPDTVLRPFETLREAFARLVRDATANQLGEETIKRDIATLQEELARPWAAAGDVVAFDLLQARLALGQRDHQEALRCVTRYLDRRPGDAQALTTLGDALAIQAEEEGKETLLDEAAARWKEASRQDPTLLGPRYSLVRLYARTQKVREAIEESEALVKLAANDTLLRRNLVAMYSTAGQHQDAQRQIEDLLRREPRSADLHAMRASVLAQRGLVAAALEALDEAVVLAPDNAWVHFSRAGLLAQTGRPEEATPAFERATQLDPRNLHYRIQAATFYWMLQQPALARPHLEAAVAMEPHSAEARGWLGQVYLAAGQWEDARREFEAALRLSPRDGRLLGNLGLLHASRNRFDLAEDYFKQAAGANPGMPHPHLLLCQLYFMQNRVAEFNAAFQRLSQVAPAAAQQLQMQLQAMRMQAMAQPARVQEALQAQWAQMLQGQGPGGGAPGPGALPPGAAPARLDEIARATIERIKEGKLPDWLSRWISS